MSQSFPCQPKAVFLELVYIYMPGSCRHWSTTAARCVQQPGEKFYIWTQPAGQTHYYRHIQVSSASELHWLDDCCCWLIDNGTEMGWIAWMRLARTYVREVTGLGFHAICFGSILHLSTSRSKNSTGRGHVEGSVWRGVGAVEQKNQEIFARSLLGGSKYGYNPHKFRIISNQT